MGTPTIPDPTTLACPRCGYDLTPMVPPPGPARDASATCSECGLQFTWNGLFEAKEQIIPRFVEHAKPGAALAISIPWTFSWLILPHRFWQRVTIEKRVCLRRALFWLVVIIPLTRLSETLLILLFKSWDRVVAYLAGVATMPTWSQVVQDVDHSFNARSWVYWRSADNPPLASSAILLALFATLMLFILTHTRREAKLRGVLVVRCWIYANSMLATLYMWNLLSIVVSLLIPGQYATSGTTSKKIENILDDAANARADGILWILTAMTAWQAWYWVTALRSLRVQHAGWVAASMVTAAALATALLLLLTGRFPLESIM